MKRKLAEADLLKRTFLYAGTAAPDSPRRLRPLAKQKRPTSLRPSRRISKPGPSELLIKVQATALNPEYWKIRKHGILAEKYPAVLGWDAAGIVEEIGEGVTGFA